MATIEELQGVVNILHDELAELESQHAAALMHKNEQITVAIERLVVAQAEVPVLTEVVAEPVAEPVIIEAAAAPIEPAAE